MYERMYVRSKSNGVPYHLWAKMLHPEDPPPHLLEAQKTCGGVYFMWSGEIFLRNFLPYPPSKYSRVKGGDVYINMFYPLKRHKLNKRETYPLSHRILLDYTGSLRGTPTMGQNPQKAR